MARVLGLLPSALIAAAQNAGAGAYYGVLRALKSAPRTSEAYALYRVAKSITSAAGTDVFQPLNQNPASNTLPIFPTKVATGFRQNVSLVYRDRTTGQISKTYFSVTSETGMTRESAISKAIAAYADQAEAYNQDLIGAVHTSAYQLMPMGF